MIGKIVLGVVGRIGALTTQIKVLLFVIILLISFGSGAYLMHKIDEGVYQRAENERITKELEANARQAEEQAEIDKKRTQELKDAETKIAGLRYCLVRGTCRLSVPTMCRDSKERTCVDNATARTDLDIGTATSLVNITERCDKITIQLNAAQDILESK